jgi:hypothetical protein
MQSKQQLQWIQNNNSNGVKTTTALFSTAAKVKTVNLSTRNETQSIRGKVTNNTGWPGPVEEGNLNLETSE